MKKLIAFVSIALLAVSSSLAGTYIWTGGGDTSDWTDKANWDNVGSPNAGDTATFNSDVTYAGSLAIAEGTLTVNVADNKSVHLTGVISGAGGITLTGSKGNLYLDNDENEYTGKTSVSGGTLYFHSIANLGEKSAVGAPTDATLGTLTQTGGKFYLAGAANTTYETDRAISNKNGQFYVEPGTCTLKVTGTFGPYCYTRGAGRAELWGTAQDATMFGRTDAGAICFYATDNTTASKGKFQFENGTIRVKKLGNVGEPSSLGTGVGTLTFGYSDSFTYNLHYDGDTDGTCDYPISIRGSKSCKADGSGACVNFYNNAEGKKISFTGSIVQHGVPAKWPTLNLCGVGDGSLGGVIGDGVAVHMKGSGTWSLDGANTSTGIVEVAAGRLDVNGSISDSCVTAQKVTVANGAVLGGTGTVYGATSVASGATVAPGLADQIGTLTFATKTLTLNSGSKVKIRFGSGTNDCLAAGALTAAGVTLELEDAGTLPQGVYTLITCDGTPDPAAFTLSGSLPANAELVAIPGAIKLQVTGGAVGTTTWVGGKGGNAWDFATQNWEGDSLFSDGKNVRFDDTGNHASPVTIADEVRPAGVSIVTDEGYAFTGTGGIFGDLVNLYKSGSGTLTLGTVNAYAGSTVISNGNFVLTGALDGSSVEVQGTSCFTQAETSVIAGENVQVTLGRGKHWLAGNNTFTGDLVWRPEGETGNADLVVASATAVGAGDVRVWAPAKSQTATVSIQPGLAVGRGQTLYMGALVSGARAVLGNNANVAWEGDVVVDTSVATPSLWIGNNYTKSASPLSIGRADAPGTTRIASSDDIQIRGNDSLTINFYSRFESSVTYGKDVNRGITFANSGRCNFYGQGGSFKLMTFCTPAVCAGAENVFCDTVRLRLGYPEDNKSTSLNLNGFDQRIGALEEIYVEKTYAGNSRTIYSVAPATLTICGADETTWGSEFNMSCISGAVSVVRAGTGTTTFAGRNRYTGETVLESGALVASVEGALAGTTNVVIKAGNLTIGHAKALNRKAALTFASGATGKITLAAGVRAEVRRGLFVDGVRLSGGTYGATGSGAEFIRDDLFAGEGCVAAGPFGVLLIVR